MRIKHLFYLLFALPLAFAACETESDDVNKTPEVKDPVLKLTSNAEVDVTAAGGEFEITYTLENKKEGVELTATCEADWVSVTAGDKVKVVIEANEGEAREAKVVVAYEAQKFEVTYKQVEKGEVVPPALTLTSEATLEFTAEGGDGEITYTLENAVEGVELAATCEATWVTELKAEEKVTFKVAANGGEARETKVVVAYGELNFEVAVKQAAKAVVKPIEVAMTSARRIGTAEFGYEVYSYDFPIVFEGEEYSALVYFVGDEEDAVLQAGAYTNADFSIYLAACAIGNEEVEYKLATVSATVAVADDVYSFDITMVDADGVVLHLTYEGEVEDMNPANNEPEAFTPAKVVASRLDTYPAGNFFLQFYVDDYRYHEIEMYDKVNPNENYLSSGKYTLADGTIGDWSTFSNGVNTNCEVSDAEIELTINDDNSVTLKGYIKSVEGHYITIDWTGTVEGFNFGGSAAEDVVVTATHFDYQFIPSSDGSHNYWICLGTDVIDWTNDVYVPDASYYFFDMYSDAAQDKDNPRLPIGEYIIDDSYAAGTASDGYSYLVIEPSAGDDVQLYPTEGKIVVTETGIEAVVTFEDGSTHTITYTGDLSLDIEVPEPEPISSLTADVSVDGKSVSIVNAVCRGDIFNVGAQYWEILLIEDSQYINGLYITLNLLASSSESYAGTYTGSANYAVNTFTPGVDGEFGKVCSWYQDKFYGTDQAWAPFADGTITVEENADGSKNFTFDCTDGLGHAIKGTIVAR